VKIISNNERQFIAENRGLGAYIMAILILLIGIGVVVAGMSKGALVIWATGFGLLIVGVIILLGNKSERLVADKDLQTVSISTKGILGSKSVDYAFDTIASLRTVEEYRQVSTGNTNELNSGFSIGTGGVGVGGRTELQLRVVTQLLMTDGSVVVIEKNSSNANGGALLSSSHANGIGQALGLFLDKPYQLINPNMNPLELVHDVISAIKGDGPAEASFTPTQNQPVSNGANRPVPNIVLPAASQPQNGPGFASLSPGTTPDTKPPVETPPVPPLS
jgi:hypothetical protein